MKTYKKSVFSAESYLKEKMKDPRILKMKAYIQHGRITTYHHVVQVAKTALKLNRRLHIHANEHDLIKGCLLHDYYLYDWHHHEGRFHGYAHPQIALETADRDFHLTDKQRNMIRSHMWPLTLFHMPRYRESWLLCVADKIVSINETLLKRR